MDDRYREGFERLLSDMDEAPQWEQVSAQQAAVPPVHSRNHGLLVAAAAFAVTIIAIGAVVFAFRGDGAPVAAPAEETIDHVELMWEQTIDLRCEGMNVFDNGGFGKAKIDIWGPNADGLVRVDATAPDGTVQTVTHTEQADDLTIERVWSSMAWEINDNEQTYRVAYCVGDAGGGTSRYHVTDLPISPRGHDLGMFVSLPAVSPTGTPLDIEAVWLKNGATVVDGEWLGIPVKVYTQETTWTDSNGVETHRFDTWFDQTQRRFERQQHATDIEALGTVTTNVEVVGRETVPAGSVSFSTEDLELTWEAPPATGSDDSPTETTTTTSIPDTVDPAIFNDIGLLNKRLDEESALIAEAQQQLSIAEDAIRQAQVALAALEARSDPPASQDELERLRVILRVAELRKEQIEGAITRSQEFVAGLEVRRAELVERSEAEAAAAAARAAALARAAAHGPEPYSVIEPVGMTPPPPLPGTDGASGSGCYPGPGDLPDGIWYGYLLDHDGPTIDFDLSCMYYGEAARDRAAETGHDADGSIWFVDHDTTIRTLTVAENADVWMLVGDASEGRHEPFSFANEWTGDESTYASCPGEDCPVWIYLNDGIVDAIVQQYLP